MDDCFSMRYVSHEFHEGQKLNLATFVWEDGPLKGHHIRHFVSRKHLKEYIEAKEKGEPCVRLKLTDEEQAYADYLKRGPEPLPEV